MTRSILTAGQSAQRRSGQTLIIALIILGVLLVLGFVFLGIVSRNITNTRTHTQRTLASDLAEAGIRYSHSQLLNSALGADWRPAIQAPGPKDPDADLMQTGGPDGLGAYSRVNFENGRALIRVRYAPADPAMFSLASDPGASLRNPSKAHNYILIEAFGRPGQVRPNDPTQTNPNRANNNEKKLIALISIGMLETARFDDNKYNVSRPAEIGWPSEIGVQYEGAPVNVPVQLGGSALLYDFGASGPAAPKTVAGYGSYFSNADLKVYGSVNVSLAAPLGDGVLVAGTIIGNNDASELNVSVSNIDSTGAWQAPVLTTYQNAGTPSLDSSNPAFSTDGGVVRDGLSGETDQAGFSRGIGRKEPPSILTVDPNTNESRYQILTRDSGALVGNGNSGRYGYGRGVYVDNFDDRQMRADETGRENVGTGESLVYDWLNPNNGQANSGWQGPFYVPRGAFLRLQSDGFIITRDSRGPAAERTWKNPDGTDTGTSKVKYRIGNIGGVPYIVNTFTPGVDITSNSIDYSLGQPFNGVLYFEGNVRVRGEVPTDIQLLVVSNATIYIEGSVTKGIVGNDYTASLSNPIAVGALATRPSSSMIGLFAKDYVTLNTTQFFGSEFNQTLEPVKDVPNGVGYDPIRMRTGGGGLLFTTEMLLDPSTDATGLNPSSTTPFALNYHDAVNGNALSVQLLMTQTMDDGPAPNAFLGMNVNPGMYTTTPPAPYAPYLFQEAGVGVYNSANAYFPANYLTPGYAATTVGYVPMYGLGNESWQRYAKFETTGFPIVDPTSVYTSPFISAPTANGTYQFLAQDSNEFELYPTSVSSVGTNDLLFARLAIAPHDIRIEAVIFAEEGSFFVIPGPPFNPNPNDTRTAYTDDVRNILPTVGDDMNLATQQADLDRMENYGNGPDCPFYDEPLDVKIQIVGSVTENMPPPISQQAEWLKRWGWIPRFEGAKGFNLTDYPVLGTNQVVGGYIPGSHANGENLLTTTVVPNLLVSYDPTLGTGRVGSSAGNEIVRTDAYGRALPPIPRLPVSPSRAYFGEVNP